MKAISNFYTLFWIIYFPSCLAFQRVIGYDWTDELLCIILMAFGVFHWSKRKRDRKMEKEMRQYWMIMLFYTVYSLIIGVTTFRGIYLDLLQQIRPYMVFYITYFMAPYFSLKQKRIIVGSMLFVTILYVIQGDTINLYRAGEEEGGIGHVATTCGMIYFLFSKQSRKNTNIAISIMLIALLGGKSKIIGQFIIFVAIVLFLKNRINYRNPKLYISLGVLVTVVVYFTWTKFNNYYVDGLQGSTTEEMMARPASYRVAFTDVIWDYFPFGPGLGTFGTAAAAKEYSPLYYKYNLYKIWGLSPVDPIFLADSFFPTLVEYGIIGIFLFLTFWRRRLIEIKRIKDDRNYKMALIVVASLFINSTSDTAYLSGKGMGFFLILGMTLSSNRYITISKVNESHDEDDTTRNFKKSRLLGISQTSYEI